MRSKYLLVLVGLALPVASCTEPIIPNFNSPTVEAAGTDPSALQLLATGILSQLRATVTGEDVSVGIFGREVFNYTPTEGRNTTHYLQGPGPLDASGFAVGNFTGPYNNARNIKNFLAAVAPAPLTQAQKDASNGFAKTIEALELISIVTTRDTIGAVVEVKDDPGVLAPFVSLDSAYKYISARLDAAATDLTNAGAASFPFALTSGFAGFSTPATFLQMNRAIAARVLVYRGSIALNRPTTGVTCPASCYAAAITALNASFITTTAANLSVGPFHTYSTATGDAANGSFFSTTSDLMAHPSIVTDAPLKANGTRDNRLLAKVDSATPLHAPSPDANAGIPSTVRFKMYPDRNAGIKIIKDEELILLRAEAEWFTGAKLAAIADIDFIRVNSGGLAASALTIASSDAAFVDELLIQRRYSLLFEGFRWNDHRRFNRLALLPLDKPTHFVAKVMPVPQGECLIRVNETTPALRGPGCP